MKSAKITYFAIGALACVAACAPARSAPPILAVSTIQDDWRDPVETTTTGAGLDGRSVSGRIRARGPAGLFSVPGTLSFRGGNLVWLARGNADSGPYQWRETGDAIEFRAEHVIENGERAIWSGSFDGTRFHDVTAVWVRVEGDWVHDLLLPDRVVMEFTPDD
ncbi:hypothetical protein [Hyphobacterium sp.]|uniref:hypothetical protein n=1 Tax=Hyphobacterium sp. TaxID=2004662 RepID=UPI003B526029